MVNIADVNLAAPDVRALHLRVASQTQVDIPLHEQLGVYRAVRRMANRAAFPQRCVLENKWPRLFPVALPAGLVSTRHREAAGRLENVPAMRVVALRATQLVFRQRMVLRQPELGLD